MGLAGLLTACDDVLDFVGCVLVPKLCILGVIFSLRLLRFLGF